MVELIGEIVLFALIGSLAVPIVMLVLAKIGYFPPVSFEAWGRTWEFAPAGFDPHQPIVFMFPQEPETIGRVESYFQTLPAVAMDQQTEIETSDSSTTFERSPDNYVHGLAA